VVAFFMMQVFLLMWVCNFFIAGNLCVVPVYAAKFFLQRFLQLNYKFNYLILLRASFMFTLCGLLKPVINYCCELIGKVDDLKLRKLDIVNKMNSTGERLTVYFNL